MTDRRDGEPKSDISAEMIRELGIAPALVNPDNAAKQLIEAIRSDIDDVSERAKATLARERHDAHEKSLRPPEE